MADMNAYVTTDGHGRLAADSKVVVLDPQVGLLTAPVPEQTSAGGNLWAHRMDAALRELGWRLAPGTPFVEDAVDVPGGVRIVTRFRAVRAES